jgi:PKHD-type hydroxylase|tara:strand:- start:232 stop:864 length:633 start_codon:yes stop_codon:yes gene_type:complete
MYVSEYTQYPNDAPVYEGDHLIVDSPVMYYKEVIPSVIVDTMKDELLEMEKVKTHYQHAEVGGIPDGVRDDSIRNSKLRWWYETHWACSIMSHYIGVANKNNWEYDLQMLESIQISIYDKDGHYGWHSDYGTSSNPNKTRKLSASLVVSDPSEYTGGDLEFIDYQGCIIKAPKEKGTIIVFDSRVPHRVTPITDGRRVSLVTWMNGPKLR